MRLASEVDLLSHTRLLDDDQALREWGGRKKRRYAYLAWLCLGSHYLYLDRPVVQALFWITGGGLLVWWILDLFRIGDLVRRRNRKALGRLLDRLESALEERLSRLETPTPAPPRPDLVPSEVPLEPPTRGRLIRKPERVGSIVVIVFALVASGALYRLKPPALYPPASAAFRTLRQVNVRATPTTAAPIVATVPGRTDLSGTVGRAGAWLRIDRGPHSGGYVALQNLERR